MRTRFNLVAATLAAGFLAAPGLAQSTGDAPPQRDRVRQDRPERPAGPRAEALSPERLAAAWEWEARTVAAALKLDDAGASSVAEHWKAVRTELQARVREMAQERQAAGGAAGERGERGARGARGGGDAAGPAAELRAKAMETLKTRLSGTLSGEQLDTAMKAFGVQTMAWDRSTDAVLQMKLEAGKRQQTLLALHTYLASQERIRAMAEGGDREAMRQAMQEARSTLQVSLAETLSEEQAGELMAAMGPARGVQRPGQGEGEAAGGRDAGERQGAGGRGGRGGRGGGRGPGGDDA
jgi:hypothetical protein